MEQPRPHLATFQARVAQFLKKLKWHRPSKDHIPLISNNARPLSTASPDLLRKPNMSIPLAGFRLDDASIPTDTDDSSSSISPTRQSRRYSAWDALTQSSVSPVFAAHGPAPLFLQETNVPGGMLSYHERNVLAPAGSSTDRLTRETSDSLLRSATPSNIVVTQDISPVSEESPQTERSQTPRPIEGSNEPVTNIIMPNPLVESESSEPPVALTLAEISLATPPLPSSTIQERRAPGTQLTMTLPSPFRITTERGLRLSPSIISRQPMPILRLPVLPVPTPTQETPVPPTLHLRHVPSLSVHGRPGVEPETDSLTGDEDEDEGDYHNEGNGDERSRNEDLEHQSDEDGDGEEMKSTGYFQSHSPLRESHCQVIDLTLPPIAGPSSRPSVSPYSPSGATSTAFNVTDDILSKASGAASSQHAFTPQPSFSKTPLSGSIHTRRRVAPMTSFEVNHVQSSIKEGRKPGLYRQPSRSMIDLSISRKDLRLKRKKSRDTVKSDEASVSGNTVETVESDHTEKLLRRTSMPTFTAASDPPPYPSFDPYPQKSVPPIIQSREDEGRERLPPYSNSLYLTAIMPCKMEFSSPGVQAKDRKWRRVFCELEGTMLRVYKCPPGASGVGIIGEWWERRVGVGDLTSIHHAPRRKSGEGPATSPSKIGTEESAVSPPSSPLPTSNRERSESQSSRGITRTPSTSRTDRRLSGTSFMTSWRHSGSPSQLRGRGAPSTSQPGTIGAMELLPVSEPTSRRNSLSSLVSHEDTPPPPTQRTPRASSRLGFLSSRMQLRSGEIQKPAKGDLIRTYTLQHAESGLGNDYLKRKNVIRVRLEGEQFLLQAADVPSVVEWIEGFQASTNIALDLDQRVMPKGPMFPRRRRRRTRPSQNGNNNRAGPSLQVYPPAV